MFIHGEIYLPRIPLITEETLTPAQRLVYDKILAGPRGVVVGPLRAVLHSAELADRWQALGEFLRFKSCLSLALRELAIIAAGRHWNSEVEWLIHAQLALEAGICKDVIAAIREAEAPQFQDPDEFAVYELARELLHYGQASDATYDRVRQRFGTVAIVELTALVGYYTMVAMTLNAHEVPLPKATSELAVLPVRRTEGKLTLPTRLAVAQVVTPAPADSL